MNFLKFLKKNIASDSTPYLFYLGFLLSTIVTLYYSFDYSNYFFWISIPLSAITIYLSKMFIFETVYDNYLDDIEKNKRARFNKLSSSDQKEYILNNPNSKIAREEEYKKEKQARVRYVDKKISEVKAPELIKTINIKTITQKTFIDYNQLPFLNKDSSDGKFEVEEKTTRHKNQTVECYDWINEKGDKLSIDEIIEQFTLRSEKSHRLSRIKLNMSPEGASRRWFKIYNDYCFYERPSAAAFRTSHVFDGKLDDKTYKNGKLQ